MLKLGLLITAIITSVGTFAVPTDFSSVYQQEETSVLVKVREEEIRDKTVSIYCAGVDLNLMVKQNYAICMNFKTGKTYELAIIGGGLNFGAAGKVIRFDVSYNSTRYSKEFDPVPGTYGGLSMGFTMLHHGVGVLAASSGNKSLHIVNISNIGYVIDMGTIAAISIR